MKQTKHPHTGFVRRFVLAAVVLIGSLLSAAGAVVKKYYITYSSESDFTLEATNGKSWNGTLYYTTDHEEWTMWDGSNISSANGKLYLRGAGNIENLLDYKTVAKGEHPTMADECFYCLFEGCTSLTTAPELPATTLESHCYYRMFSGCTSLKVSNVKTDEYGKPWRIPTVGSISEEVSKWNGSMLSGTGGTFIGKPSINTTYYLYGTETGIATAEAQPAALLLYPNPVGSYVNVSGQPAGGGTVQIFDVAGRLVLSVKRSGEETQTIDISGLAPGLHYVRSGSQTAKLMVK